MPIFSWKLRRQLVVWGVLAVIVAGAGWYFVSVSLPTATCQDLKQNQNETGVDCGGSCKPCLANLSEPIVLWSRFFALGDGVYEAAALIENIHATAAADRAVYSVKLYDANNILITQRANETYINPNERFLILEPGLVTGERIPARAVIEFKPISWHFADYAKPNVVVVSRDFQLEPKPRLAATLRNAGSTDLSDVQVAAILRDASGNAYAASITTISDMAAGAERTVSFSWPQGVITSAPAAVDVLVRTPVGR